MNGGRGMPFSFVPTLSPPRLLNSLPLSPSPSLPSHTRSCFHPAFLRPFHLDISPPNYLPIFTRAYLYFRPPASLRHLTQQRAGRALWEHGFDPVDQRLRGLRLVLSLLVLNLNSKIARACDAQSNQR